MLWRRNKHVDNDQKDSVLHILWTKLHYWSTIKCWKLFWINCMNKVVVPGHGIHLFDSNKPYLNRLRSRRSRMWCHHWHTGKKVSKLRKNTNVEPDHYLFLAPHFHWIHYIFFCLTQAATEFLSNSFEISWSLTPVLRPVSCSAARLCNKSIQFSVKWSS